MKCSSRLDGFQPDPRRVAPLTDRPVLMMLVLLSTFLFFVSDWCGDVEGRLPVLLDGGWKVIEVGEQHGDLPHVPLGESFIPGGHAGVATAGAHSVYDVPLGIVGRIGGELRRLPAKRNSPT